MRSVNWKDIVDPKYLQLLEHKKEDEAHHYFDLDIQAGFFSIVRKEKRDSFLNYLKMNECRLKLNGNAKLQKYKLWLHSKRFRIEETSKLETFNVEPKSIYLDGNKKANVEFECITGELIKSKYVHIEIDSSLEERIELHYMIPKWTYVFVSYWDQKEIQTIERYNSDKLHGIRLKMSKISYHNILQ